MSISIMKYDHAGFPDLKSEKSEKLANQLYQWYRRERDARSELERNIWPACDAAYQCIRQLPENRAMVWADKSDKGENDIQQSVDFLTDAIMMDLMGREGAWFQPVSYTPEDQATQNTIRDYLYARHRDAGSREQIGVHIGQVLRRGTGAYGSEWKKIFRVKRYDPAESKVMLDTAAQQVADMGIDPTAVLPELSKQLRRERKLVLAYNGPVVRPLDMYDTILDSVSALRRDDDLPMCTIVYKTVEELKDAEDEQGEKLYGNLDDLTEWSAARLYEMAPGRYDSLQTIGINPLLMSGISGSSFVPVLIFHRMVQKLDNSDDKWIDSFFYVALTAAGTPVLIRCHENPSDYGHRDVFIDTYRDWTNAAYGRGIVENALTNWNKKNIVSALTLNAMLVTQFPPLAMITDMMVDDRRLDVAPGGFNLIEWKAGIGTNFVAPLPIAQGGGERGMEYERFLGQKILGDMGAYGALMQDPTKSITNAKTATQVNTESSSGTTSQQNFLEKLSKSLEPFAQKFYDDCRQYEEDEMISFIVNVESGDPTAGQVARDVLDKDRRIVVTGYHGLLNKQQEMQNAKDIFQMLTTGNAAQILPNAPLWYQKLIMLLAGDLGMKNLDELKSPPIELMKKDPMFVQQFQQLTSQLAQGLLQQHVPMNVVTVVVNMLASSFLPPPEPQPGEPGQGPPQGPPGAVPGQGAPSNPPMAPQPAPQGPPAHQAQHAPQAHRSQQHPAMGGQDIGR